MSIVLYVVTCANGEPCKVDLGGGSTWSRHEPAGEPTWNREFAERCVKILASGEVYSKVECGPHSIVEYRRG